jgi:hypothetical protein
LIEIAVSSAGVQRTFGNRTTQPVLVAVALWLGFSRI